MSAISETVVCVNSLQECMESNLRSKIILNLDLSDSSDLSYRKISYNNLYVDYRLIQIFNTIFECVSKLDIYTKFKYVILQIEEPYLIGVKFVGDFKDISDIFDTIQNFTFLQFDVLCYSDISDLSETFYISKNQYLEYRFNNISYNYSICAFRQNHSGCRSFTHSTVYNILQNLHITKFVGIGGESGFYSKMVSVNSHTDVFTNSSEIHLCNVYNNVNSYLIDYTEYDFIQLQDCTIDVIVINIGIAGLQKYDLCNRICKLKSQYIIYIGCKSESVISDITKLKSQYNVIQSFKYKFENTQIQSVLFLQLK